MFCICAIVFVCCGISDYYSCGCSARIHVAMCGSILIASLYQRKDWMVFSHIYPNDFIVKYAASVELTREYHALSVDNDGLLCPHSLFPLCFLYVIYLMEIIHDSM